MWENQPHKPLTKQDKKVVATVLIFGAIAFYLIWIYRDTLDPNWEQRAEKAKRRMEQMDRGFRD